MIIIRDYPQLALIAWNRNPDFPISEVDALSLYEENWRHVDEARLEPHERRLIDDLVIRHGNGVLLV